jgi:hypothetical protein
LVLPLEQVVSFRYRTQDGVSLQETLLRSHELVIAGGEETIVSDRLRRSLPVNGNDGGTCIDGGQQGAPKHDQGSQHDAEEQDRKHMPS